MLIFNCTKAAAEFFTTTRKGEKICPVYKPQSKDFDLDPSWLTLNSGETPELFSQWIINVVKVQRKNVVIAMERDSRYAMVFTGLRKGDTKGFVAAFTERFINAMMHVAVEFNLVEASETSFHNIERAFDVFHPEYNFLLRSDNSVIGHIKQVTFQFEHAVWDQEFLIDAQEALYGFDESINGMIRKTKARKDYFYPQQEMFATFMSHYLTVPSERMTEFREQFRLKQRSCYADGLNIPHNNLPEPLQDPPEPNQPADNVISMAEYRQKKRQQR